jgi:hypothetical protein
MNTVHYEIKDFVLITAVTYGSSYWGIALRPNILDYNPENAVVVCEIALVPNG